MVSAQNLAVHTLYEIETTDRTNGKSKWMVGAPTKKIARQLFLVFLWKDKELRITGIRKVDGMLYFRR